MRTTMEEREARMAKIENNIANFKSAYEKFAAAPRYVSGHSSNPELIELKFGNDDAIQAVFVQMNWKGDIIVKLGMWSGCPDKTRKAIESKKFENVEEALDYALETVNKINSFFNQF